MQHSLYIVLAAETNIKNRQQYRRKCNMMNETLQTASECASRVKRISVECHGFLVDTFVKRHLLCGVHVTANE